ncbi:MAG: hypothetical protein Q8R29_02840 [bacterium]|nr:hypothetical protein [bacterium]
MIRKILDYFQGLFGKTPDERNESLLFYLTSGLLLAWCILIGIEAFGLNVAGRNVLPEVTVLMLSVMTGYTGHKGYARWGNKTLHGSQRGKTFGAMALTYGMLIYYLNLRMPEVLVPAQLSIGLEGIVINIFGWQIIKAAHARIQNGSGENNSEVSKLNPDTK